jgi:vacuolar-type H+-ATPase subunit H
MGAQKASGHGHDHHADENLLHLIAEKERALEAQLAATRTEAAALLEQARAQAEQIRERARSEAAAAAREQERRVAAEVARIQEELTAQGRGEVETLRRQANDGHARAVQLVVERIVKGLPA